MPKEENIGITVKKEKDMPEWYSQICQKAELADYAPVKGCMIIRPNGYAIWESIQNYFNKRLKALNVRNAYFPLFIPESFFKKEAEHAKGFTPEVAWIDKEVTKEGERLAVRPTSETIMYDSYSSWIRSHRDLPLRINQWCNIVRWEAAQTKLFLRSREFLWQEGHCVYETEEQCHKETVMMLKEYQKLAEELLAIPLLVGQKTEKEKFAGAKTTYTIEAFMPDGKALQCGTSHDLGQGFAKSFKIKYIGKDKKEHTPWQNSWGFSTRLIGALVMTHSDNKGLVLPPEVAETKAVIIPILFEKTKDKVIKKVKEIAKKLEEFNAIYDTREEYTPGWKYSEWEMKGIPLRIEIGPKDIEKNQVIIVRRDTGEKTPVKEKEIKTRIKETLDKMQKDLYKKAKSFLKESIMEASDWDAFASMIKAKKIVKAPFCGETECEDYIKEKTEGASSRCIPLDDKPPKTKCIHCKKPAKYNVYFSKSY
ncbi:proline--tRNA ligase [Candidatus Woesearchaeota archaeon]|nr:proline--tRNA ligase [Candidatus Woesearchaeota archaeon]